MLILVIMAFGVVIFAGIGPIFGRTLGFSMNFCSTDGIKFEVFMPAAAGIVLWGWPGFGPVYFIGASKFKLYIICFDQVRRWVIALSQFITQLSSTRDKEIIIIPISIIVKALNA